MAADKLNRIGCSPSISCFSHSLLFKKHIQLHLTAASVISERLDGHETVQLRFRNKVLGETSCSCSYGFRPLYCPHEAAVLNALKRPVSGVEQKTVFVPYARCCEAPPQALEEETERQKRILQYHGGRTASLEAALRTVVLRIAETEHRKHSSSLQYLTLRVMVPHAGASHGRV